PSKALAFPRMTPPTKVAALAVGLAALLAVTACGPGASPSPGSATSAPAPASATPAPTTAPPAAHLDGTLFFLGIGAAGGIYYLHGGTLTLAISNPSFGFYQSATMSPDGKKLAWIPADAAGSVGQLRVQTYGGGTVTIGPSTITNTYTPQWT